jgi:acyl-[acyl-carrier-protein] desaturase
LLLTKNIASARGRYESRLRGPSKPPVENAGEFIEPTAFDRKTSETMPPSMREQAYRIYLEFLETAENKRRWNIFNDIPWEKLDAGKATEEVGNRVEIFCTEELYVPDYSSRGLDLSRSIFGLAWFQTCWAFEESRHGLVFREYLTRSGLRSPAQFEALETATFAEEWKLPFQTVRQMACYGALQESATFTAYNLQRNRAREAGDEVLEAIFLYVGRDEAAHAGFYRDMIQLELVHDRDQTIADLAHVLLNFKMPGDGLIPDYRRRLESSGAGISPRIFLARVVWPLLTTLEISREEMKSAMKKHARVTVSNERAESSV